MAVLRLLRKTPPVQGGYANGLSKEVAENSKERNYYWRWLVQIGRQARTDVWELVVGLIIALAVLLLQVHYGKVQAEDFRLDAASNLWSYLVVIGFYLLYAVVRSPFELDKQRALEIASKDRQLAQFQRPIVDVEWRTFEIGLNGSEGECGIVRLHIATDDKPVTLTGWTLSADGESRTNPIIGFNDPAGNYIGRQPSLRLLESHVTDGFLQFRGKFDSAKKWRLTFLDHREKLYTLNDPTIRAIV